jgi:hypothetical protein
VEDEKEVERRKGQGNRCSQKEGKMEVHKRIATDSAPSVLESCVKPAGSNRFLSFILALFICASYARAQSNYRCTYAHVRTCIPASMRIPAAQSACKRAHTPGTCT